MNRNGSTTPCLLGVSKVGRNQNGYITLPSRGAKSGEDSKALHNISMLVPLKVGSQLKSMHNTLLSLGHRNGNEKKWLYNPWLVGS